jgi:hypothetical protein
LDGSPIFRTPWRVARESGPQYSKPDSYTKADDGLAQPWHGLVFMNPPFGGCNGHVPWLIKFLKHADGIAIVRAYTSSGWWHAHVAPCAEILLFPRGKTKFIRPDGSIGKGQGTVLYSWEWGKLRAQALRRSGLGFCATIEKAPSLSIATAAADDKFLPSTARTNWRPSATHAVNGECAFAAGHRSSIGH